MITLGSASARTDPAVLRKMLWASRWFVAMDADESGDKAAAKFPARAIRVRPPAPDNDWGEVHAGGPNRIRYIWGSFLAMARSWEELSVQRWGPALNDPTPDIIIDRPQSQDPARLKAVWEGADRADPYALAEREAIQREDAP